MSFSVTYDACVLHPASLRDLLVRLAMTRLFRAHWSDRILDEMVRSVLARRPDLSPTKLARTCTLMCHAVRDCLITGYEDLIEGLTLPDPDDRHVLAVAIRSGSQVVVTENIQDFPASELEKYNIVPQTPDVFVRHLIDLAPHTVVSAVQVQAAALSSPPMDASDVLNSLAQLGLRRSVAELRRLVPPTP